MSETPYVVVLSTKVTPEIAERFDAVAEAAGKTRYQMLQDAVMIMIESHEPTPRKRRAKNG